MNITTPRLGLAFGVCVALAGCLADQSGLSPTAGASSGRSAPQEYLVLGSNMGFEDCRARGGIIIRDAASPMVACDPRVTRQPVPADEFDHPGSPVPQSSTVEG